MRDLVLWRGDPAPYQHCAIPWRWAWWLLYQAQPGIYKQRGPVIFTTHKVIPIRG